MLHNEDSKGWHLSFNRLQENARANARYHYKAPDKKKENRQACLEQHEVDAIEDRVSTIMGQHEELLSEEEKEIWSLIRAVNSSAQKIKSCDLPTDDEEIAPLVKTVQDRAKIILEDTSKTWLQRIIDVASYSTRNEVGNCMEKAFFGFVAMLRLREKNPVDLKLVYFDNHFALIVKNRFFMDPWLNLAFPLPAGEEQQTINDVFEGFGKMVDYFSIEGNECYTYGVQENAKKAFDSASTRELGSCLQALRGAHIFDLSPSKETEKKRKPLTGSSEEILLTQTPSTLFQSPNVPKKTKQNGEFNSLVDELLADFGDTEELSDENGLTQ